jgi:hypothetical protein
MAKQQSGANQSAQPPFYVATQDIHLGDPEAGTVAVAAFREGDQVHPGIVEAYDLGDAVKVPDEFAGQFREPSGPSVPPGQTTSAAQIAPAGSSVPTEGGKD